MFYIGLPGVIGPRGHPGDTKLSEEESSNSIQCCAGSEGFTHAASTTNSTELLHILWCLPTYYKNSTRSYESLVTV